MKRRRGPAAATWLALLVLVSAGGAVAWAVCDAQRLPNGPVPVAWGRAACAHCGMHVSEPRFAVQVQHADGRVFDFDDVGCWFRHDAEAAAGPAPHAVWFHDVKEDSWIPRSEVAFMKTPGSPMGSELGAVRAGTPGALSIDAVRQQLARPPSTRDAAAPPP